ncbi:MAG: class I SAM-dependent methyltransferase, partial [Patescibacteria group bacterium]
RVYAIDPHVGSVAHRNRNIKSTFNILKKNVMEAGVDRYVEVIPKTSVEANLNWPKKQRISLLWIDADHGFHSVKEDFLLWSRYVTPGGIIILHDVIGLEGPRRLMLSYILKSREFVCTSLVGEMATLKKKRKMKMRNLLSKDYFNFLSLLRNAMYFLVLSVFYKFDTPKSYK